MPPISPSLETSWPLSSSHHNTSLSLNFLLHYSSLTSDAALTDVCPLTACVCACVYLCTYTPLCLSCVCIIASCCCTPPVCVYLCVYILAGRQLSMYLSEGCADSANQCCVSSARSSCTCQRACPGCKCRKIVCLSERIHNICLIMNASARRVTCLEERDGRL